MKKNRFAFSLIQVMLAIAVIGLLTMLAVPAAHADAGLVQFATTNSVAATSTNTVHAGGAVKVDNQETVGIYIRSALNGAGTTAMTFVIARSIDGTSATTESTPAITLTVTPAGATPGILYTNLSSTVIGSAPYLVATSVGNPNASALTNVVFGVVKKNITR